MEDCEFVCDLTSHVLAVPWLAVGMENFHLLLNAFKFH